MMVTWYDWIRVRENIRRYSFKEPQPIISFAFIDEKSLLHRYQQRCVVM